MLSVGWSINGLEPNLREELDRTDIEHLMTLPSHELHARFQACRSQYEEDSSLQTGSWLRAESGSYFHQSFINVANLALLLLIRGDEYAKEIIAVMRAITIPVELQSRFLKVWAVPRLVESICAHPNLTGHKPYNFLALRDRLVKVLTQVPVSFACFFAGVIGNLIDFMPTDSGMMIETMPEEFFVWLPTLHLTLYEVDLHNAYMVIHTIFDRLFLRESTTTRAVEALVLVPYMECQLQAFFSYGRLSFSEFIRIEAPSQEAAGSSQEAAGSLSPSWRLFLDERANMIAAVYSWAREDNHVRQDCENAFRECIIPALFLMDQPRLDLSFVQGTDILDLHEGRAQWCQDFSDALRDGSWNTDQDVRDDIIQRLETRSLWFMPNNALKALCRAVRTPRGGNILHYIIESDPVCDITRWSMLLDFADINELDEDLQAPIFLLRAPRPFLEILFDSRVDIQKHGSSKILAHWSGIMESSYRCLFRDSDMLKLVHRGLFRDETDPSMLLRCLKRSLGVAPLHAMTLYRTIWSSSISFDCVDTVHRVAFEEIVPSEQRTVWQGCLNCTRVAIVLCSVKATGIKGAICKTPLRILSVDLLRLILASLWHAPPTGRQL